MYFLALERENLKNSVIKNIFDKKKAYQLIGMLEYVLIIQYT